MTPENPIIAFPTPAAFRTWLAKHHDASDGIRLRIYKKDSGIKTITYDQAVEEALCFGWIDGLKNALDEKSWTQRFTPRRAKSGWSKINTERVARLIKEKRMQPSGLVHVLAAKKDGRWEKAYDSQSFMVVPEDFLKAIAKNKKAKAFFESLNKANIYAIVYRLQTAKKPETRVARMEKILQMMRDGLKFH